jgi:hypothetical protein
MPIIPSGNLSKSLKVGTPYSPAVSFNPDKKLIFDTHTTTLGMLSGGPLTTDGVNVTVPTGVSFVQNGIIITLTAPAIIPIGGGGFPKYVVADNVDEVPGSAVTIAVLPSIVAPQVLLATLDPNALTIVQVQKISIRALSERIDAVAVDTEQDDVAVKPSVGTLNAIGPNALLSAGPGDQANLTVKLDVKEATVAKTVRTEELDFYGSTVTPTGNKAAIDSRLQVKEETVLVNGEVRKLNFEGGGVTATQDGGDASQVNVTIPAGGGLVDTIESVMGSGIVKGLLDGDGGIRQVNATALIILRAGILYGPITTTVAVTTNVSGSPRTDLVQYDGVNITVKAGTPGATFPCPAPDPGNIPLAVVLVPNSPAGLVNSINKQAALGNPVIVAHYYANGGLHASRVGVTSDPVSSSSTYVDAEEMALSVYFPRVGYRYELNWDTVIKQNLYGFLNEGAFINMSWDGSDEDDAVVARGNMENNLLGGVSIHGWEKAIALHYQRLVTVGSHLMVGRWRVGQISTPERLSQRRRRIWIVETA